MIDHGVGKLRAETEQESFEQLRAGTRNPCGSSSEMRWTDRHCLGLGALPCLGGSLQPSEKGQVLPCYR